MLRGILMTTVALATTAVASMASAAEAGGPPTLQVVRGRIFSWARPTGWQQAETANGVDLTAPGGQTLVSSAVLINAFGETDPMRFIAWTFQMRGIADARVLSSTPLPAQPSGFPGVPWTAADVEVAFTQAGVPMRSRITCGTLSAWGRFSTTMTLWQAPAAEWAACERWLPAIARSITVVDGRALGGQDRVLLPRNNPLDNDDLIETWRRKGISEDRISRDQQEATMGYERSRSPSTGRSYDMPFEAWDAGNQAFRNPDDPTEFLERAPLGE